ncbi:MAG: heme o synthase [Pseudomonadota bacterium]
MYKAIGFFQSSITFPWQDYFALCKPKVVALLLLTAVVGMVLALDPNSTMLYALPKAFVALLGIGLAASAAAAINHLVDRNIDAKMARTTGRPIPQGKVKPRNALVFAFVLTIISMSMLYFLINPLTAILTLFGLLGYAVVYTVFLKRATPQNIVIGGLAGALPPLLGWTAMMEPAQIQGEPLLLVLIIFAWTPPHFWALAIHRKEDYAKAGIPMLPVTHGENFTKTCILLYTVLLLAITWLPYLIKMTGIVYLLSANLLGAWFLYYVLKLKIQPEEKTAIKTFMVSIYYLLLLFVALFFDHFYKIYLI